MQGALGCSDGLLHREAALSQLSHGRCRITRGRVSQVGIIAQLLSRVRDLPHLLFGCARHSIHGVELGAVGHAGLNHVVKRGTNTAHGGTQAHHAGNTRQGFKDTLELAARTSSFFQLASHLSIDLHGAALTACFTQVIPQRLRRLARRPQLVGTLRRHVDGVLFDALRTLLHIVEVTLNIAQGGRNTRGIDFDSGVEGTDFQCHGLPTLWWFQM